MNKAKYVCRPDLLLRGVCGSFLRSRRLSQLEENIPDIWSYDSVLYIGARENRMDFGANFRDNDYRIDVLEIFEANVRHLRDLDWINRVIHGDVREADSFVEDSYDVVFWWHGPEHIHKSELPPTLDGLREIAEKLVVCGCPWGKYEQGEAYGNPWETHLSSLYEEDFEMIGFRTSTLGRRDLHMSNLLSWCKV